MNAEARTVYSNFHAKHSICLIPVLFVTLGLELVISVVVSGDLKSVPYLLTPQSRVLLAKLIS
jgi:hypothetical protein